jgi:hypothetical protein
VSGGGVINISDFIFLRAINFPLKEIIKCWKCILLDLQASVGLLIDNQPLQA